MKTRLLFTIILILVLSVFKAQVGIQNSTPKATLDVVGKPTQTTAIDGIIAPRIGGNQLKAKDAVYGKAQTGTIVYATVAANPTSIKTVNVTEAGYYYFDGSVWLALKVRLLAMQHGF